ncbi:hypothetical protein ES705_46981 [subsurface metagenome]
MAIATPRTSIGSCSNQLATLLEMMPPGGPITATSVPVSTLVKTLFIVLSTSPNINSLYRLDRLPSRACLWLHIRFKSAYCTLKSTPPRLFYQSYQRHSHWYPLRYRPEHHSHGRVAGGTAGEAPSFHSGYHPFVVLIPHMLSHSGEQYRLRVSTEALTTLATARCEHPSCHSCLTSHLTAPHHLIR